MPQFWKSFKNIIFIPYIYRKPELQDQMVKNIYSCFFTNYLAPKTIDGKSFNHKRKFFYLRYLEKRTSFSQGLVIDKIKNHPEKKIDFNAYKGMCAGLTRYWFLSQILRQNIIARLKDIDFEHISRVEKDMISDINQMQALQLLPTFICTASSFLHSEHLKYNPNYAYLYYKKEQIELIKNSTFLSSQEKEALVKPLSLIVKDKVFHKDEDTPIPHECISSILKQTINSPGTLIEVTFICPDEGSAHVVGLAALPSSRGRLTLKYFDSNTGERVFRHHDLEKCKHILREELNHSNPYKKKVDILISTFQCTEEVQLKMLNIIFLAYLLHHILKKSNDKMNVKKDHLSQKSEEEYSTPKVAGR